MPMDVILGMLIDTSAVHPRKVESTTDARFGMLIDTSEVQP